MIETLTIITISIIALIIFRPGKTPPLENPLTINRIGQFHAVLAPRLNLAQPFLELVSRRIPAESRKGDTESLYYRVEDGEVKAHGQANYLLAVTLRQGVLYFQAAAPVNGQEDLGTLKAFAEKELSKHPAGGETDATLRPQLADALQAAASERKIALSPL